MDAFQSGGEPAATAAAVRAHELRNQIWYESVAICRAQNVAALTTILLAALNDMADVATERAVAAQVHPPGIIFAMLALVAWATAGLLGAGTAEGAMIWRMHIVVYATMLSLILYVIAELELPRAGLIRIEAFDQALEEVRHSMGQGAAAEVLTHP